MAHTLFWIPLVQWSCSASHWATHSCSLDLVLISDETAFIILTSSLPVYIPSSFLLTPSSYTTQSVVSKTISLVLIPFIFLCPFLTSLDPTVDININSLAYSFQLYWPFLPLFYHLLSKKKTQLWLFSAQCGTLTGLLNAAEEKCSTTLRPGLLSPQAHYPQGGAQDFLAILHMLFDHLCFHSSTGLFNTLSSLLTMPTCFPPLSICSRLSSCDGKSRKRKYFI